MERGMGGGKDRGRRGRKREGGEEGGTPGIRRGQLTAVQQKHKHYSRPWACRHPNPHTGRRVGWRGDTQGRKRTRHKTQTEKHPHLNRQVKTVARTHTSITIMTGTPSVLEVTHALLPSGSDQVGPGCGGVCLALLDMHT